MKHFKKMMALIIALVMVIGTLNMSVFAAGALTPDPEISITGLDAGDTVKLYQVLEWTDGVGWRLTNAFSTLNTSGINDIIANTPNTQVNAADIAAITALISDTTTAVDTKTITGTTYTYTPNPDKPGMFIALIENAKEGVIYTPIVISADFSADNLSSIPASSVTYGTTVPKKTSGHVTKTAEQAKTALKKAMDSKVGDVVDFDVDTFIPVFSKSGTPGLKIVDRIVDQEGIEMIPDSLTVSIAGDSTKYTTSNYSTAGATIFKTFTIDKNEYTIEFQPDYLKTIAAPTDVHIDYQGSITSDAKFNVNEDKNEVTVYFTNNGKTTGLRDRTNHYTFSIGAELFGKDKGITSELWKAGINPDGTPAIAESKDSWEGIRHPLEGAVFGLYTDADCTKAYTNDLYPSGATCTSAGDGTLTFKGLASGTYYLKELSAPKGFIKDDSVTEITITAEYTPVNVGPTTETQGTNSVAIAGYTTEILSRYSVSVNNVYKYDSGKYGLVPNSVVNVYTYDNEDGVPEISNLTDEAALNDAIRANPTGVELPSTGGVGTTIFYVIGAILVLGAGILLVTRRRMREE